MRRFAMKALFMVLNFNRAERQRIDWVRAVIISSTAVTFGLIALYIFGKSTARAGRAAPAVQIHVRGAVCGNCWYPDGLPSIRQFPIRR